MIQAAICIFAEFELNIQGNSIIQKMYFTENWVFTEVVNKKILYLSHKDKEYTVNTETQTLEVFDVSMQIKQLEHAKSMIGVLEILEKHENEIKHISIKNTAESPVKLVVDLQIEKYIGIDKTAYSKFNEYQQKVQLFKINLLHDEIITSTTSFFSTYNQIQKTKMKLVEISNKSDYLNEIENYCKYKIDE